MNTTTKAFFYSLLALALVLEYTYKAGVFVAPYLKRGVALVITLAIIAGDVVAHLYDNKTEYLTQLNKIRNDIGSYFTYPALA